MVLLLWFHANDISTEMPLNFDVLGLFKKCIYGLDVEFLVCLFLLFCFCFLVCLFVFCKEKKWQALNLSVSSREKLSFKERLKNLVVG